VEARPVPRPAVVLPLCMALLATLFAPACDEPDEARAWALRLFEDMEKAERETSYQGTKELLYRYGDHERRSFHFVTHYAGDVTLVESGGPGGGRTRRWRESRPRFEYLLKDRELLLDNYRVRPAGRETVARRDGVVVIIRSRIADASRPSMRLVLDPETKLVLSSEIIDWRGETGFRSRYTSLLLDPVLGAPPEPRRGGREERRRMRPKEVESEAEAGVPFTPLVPRHLPRGFRRMTVQVFGHRFPTVRSVYSDGLSWIEIRQWKARPGREERVVRTFPRGSRVKMKMALHGVGIMLDGRLDPEELKKVIRSLGDAR